MAIERLVHVIKIADIKIGDRFREDYGDLEGLATNIAKRGLLHPIILDKENALVAGERRIKAHLLLGRDEIEHRYTDEMDELEKREMELEENVNRHNFGWAEELNAKFELDRIKRALYGSTSQGKGGGWSIRDTAQAFGESIGTTSQDLTLARAIKQFPELLKEKTKSAAFKRLQRMRIRVLVGTLAERAAPSVEVDECLKHMDGVEWMKGMANGSVDMLLCDPPYAVDIDKAGMFRGRWDAEDMFSDTGEAIFTLIENIAREAFRVLKPNSHGFIFYASVHWTRMCKIFLAAGFDVCAIPLIWNKESATAPPSVPYAYSNAYEPIMQITKGIRMLNEYRPNVFSVARVASVHKIHPTEKPISLLRMLIENSTSAGDVVIDPCAGSAATVVAALSCKRKGMGAEISETHFNSAKLRVIDFLDDLREPTLEDTDL